MASLLGSVCRRNSSAIILQSRTKCFRLLSTSPNSDKLSTSESAIEDEKVGEHEEKKVYVDKSEGESEFVPWYLREDSLSPLAETKQVELPTVPEHAPSSVDTFLNLISNDYGLDDIELFDLHSLDPEHESHADNQAADYIIICTGKSEKHIYKAANELRTYIKHNFKLIPKLEGMASNSKTPAARRRMLRRARKGPLATDNDYGRSVNSWVMCDTFVDNIFIHILTNERRQELSLESLWCRKEELEKYSKAERLSDDSDDIFIGIRRFHTMTPFAKQFQQGRSYSVAHTNKNLQTHFQKLTMETPDIPLSTLKDYLQSFEASFIDPSVKDFNVRYDFHKALHVLNSEVMSFEDVKSSLLDKYNSLPIMLNKDVNVSDERSQDMIRFMKLLIDSPQIQKAYNFSDRSQVNAYSDELYDRLSQFVSTLFRFSGEQIDMTTNREFIPLLWRLSFVQIQNVVIGPRLVDNIIHQESLLPEFSNGPSIIQASNRARDIQDLINYYNQTVNPNSSPTSAFKELLLFTYGNAGNWSKFWSTWEVSFNLLDNIKLDNKSSIRNWVRLIVYLATRNDKSAIVYFLNNYWDHSSSVAGSFIDAFASNDSVFNSDEEKRSFKSSMRKMLKCVNNENNGGAESFISVREFIDNLN